MSNIITLPTAQPVQPVAVEGPQLFTIDNLPIHSQHGPIAGKRGLFVDQNCINIVSDKYEIHQPQEIYNRFVSVTSQAGLTLNRVLPNARNGGLLLSAKYDQIDVLGEQHDVNLTFFTSHDGKYKTFLTLDLLRIACFNQVPMLYAGKSRFIFSEKHYSHSLDLDLIEEILCGIPSTLQEYASTAEILKDKQINFDLFAEMYASHYKLRQEQKQFDSKLDKIRSIYYNAPGQRHLEENAYKAFQTITYLNTHEGKQTALKQENAYIKGGNDSLVFMRELLAA